MATFVTTPHGKHKAIIRMAGWPIKTKTFQFKRDAKNWARDTEAEMVRGVYIERSVSEKLTIAKALEQYLAEVIAAEIGDFVGVQPTSVLEQKLVSYELTESAWGSRATNKRLQFRSPMVRLTMDECSIRNSNRLGLCRVLV